MAVKVRTKFKMLKQLKSAQSLAAKQIKAEIVDLIQDEYDKGKSPVKGFNRFAPYEKSTAKKKGRKRPVTIKESGKLRESLRAVKKKDNRIAISFKGARNSKIASFLSYGTEFMDARPLLPSAKGQVFKKGIVKRINTIISKALKKFT